MKYNNNIKFIPSKDILINPYNMTTIPDNIYNSLKKNIQENGFIGAILIRPHPLKQGKYEIIDGEKRFKILTELNEPNIPSIILKYNDINTILNMIRFNREHGYFHKDKTKTVIDDLIKKTNKLFIREKLSCGLKEFDDIINDNPTIFEKNPEIDTIKYTNILQESEKNKKLFY